MTVGGDVELNYDVLARELGLLDSTAARRLRFLRDGFLKERWVVFVGAGVSCGAGLPSWDELTRKLANTYGIECPAKIVDNAYPEILERCLQKAPTPEHFWDSVASEVCGGEPSEMHTLLMRLPFEACLTTNFDCLLESSHQTLTRVHQPAVLSYPKLKGPDISGRRLIHVHGRCEHQGGKPHLTEYDTVLTARSYEVAYTQTSLPLTLETAIDAYPFLLIGASLGDWQIRQLLSKVRERQRLTARSNGTREMGIRGYALVESDGIESTSDTADLTWSGLVHGLEPIFYQNADRTHVALQNAVRWLVQETSSDETIKQYNIP